MIAQKLDQRHQHPRRAEAALEAVVVAECLLQRVQPLGRGREALHRRDLVPVRLHREHQAGARRLPVDEDRARAADAVLAAEVRPREPERPAQEIGERQAYVDAALVALAVDRHGDVPRLAHRDLSFVILRAQPEESAFFAT